MLTVDAPVAGPAAARRAQRPDHSAVAVLADLRGGASPRWWFDLITTEPLEFASLHTFDGTVAELVGQMFDPAATIDDLACAALDLDRAAGRQGHPERRRRARRGRAGADAVVVSNHGGRQLDRAPTPLELLPGIVSTLSATGPRCTSTAASSRAVTSSRRSRSAPAPAWWGGPTSTG